MKMHFEWLANCWTHYHFLPPPPWATCHLATFPCCTSVQLCPSSCPYAGCKFLIHFATLPNSFCNRRSFLFTTTLAVPCRAKALMQKQFPEVFTSPRTWRKRERERGRQRARTQLTVETHCSTLDSIRKPIRLRLCGSSCVCVVRLCMSVSVCVLVCICADDVARPARILKLTNCAL